MGSSKIRGKHKGGGEKRSSLPREELVPDTEDISQIDAASVQLFRPVLEADSLGSQVDQVKQLLRDPPPDSFQIVAIVTVQWYFSLPPGSGLRKVISNCLNQVQEAALCELLTEQIRGHVRQCAEASGRRQPGHVVRRLLCAFDNFKLGTAAVLAESEAVLSYLLATLEQQMEAVCEEDVSPVERTRLTDEAGDSVRLLVFLVKANLGSPQLLAGVSSLVYRILCQESLAMELRSNCGHIYVLLERAARPAQLEEAVTQLASCGRTEDGKFSVSGSCGAVLALLHGFVSTLSREAAEGAEAGRGGQLSAVLGCYLAIARADQGAGAVLGVSKGLLAWAHKLLLCGSEAAAVLERYRKETFEYIWASLDQPIDSVKHNTKNLVRHLVTSLVAAGAEETVDQFLADTLQLPPHSKPRLVALCCLVQTCSAARLLARHPDLVRDNLRLLSSEAALGNLVTDLLCHLVQALARAGLGVGRDAVVAPLVRLYTASSSQAVANCVTAVLGTAAKLDLTIVDSVLQDPAHTPPPKLALTCLKMSRDRGREWSWPRNEKLLRSALEHHSEATRLQALALCVESHSSVEVFSEPELFCLVTMILDHLDLQSPSSQQTFVVIVHKMIQRIHDGAAAMCKKLTQNKFEKEFPFMKNALVYYNKTLQDFVVTLLDNLYPGANYPRRTTVLNILTSLSSTIGLASARHQLDLTLVVGPRLAATLLEALHDSYEANKEAALALLLQLPPAVLGHCDPEAVRARLEATVRLMRSSKPPDTVTSCYLARLLAPAPGLHWVLADQLGLLHASHYSADYLLVVFLRNQLAAQLSGAEASLLEAASSAPMYGTLGVLRAVYREIAASRAAWSDVWVQLTRDVVRLCHGVWAAVSSVVVSDSPEGHLPCDGGAVTLQRLARTQGLAGTHPCRGEEEAVLCTITSKATVSEVFTVELVEEILDDIVDSVLGDDRQCSSDLDDMVKLENDMSKVTVNDVEAIDDEEFSENEISKAKEVSSQMLLLCAWRSVKEVSLFLSELCSTFKDSSSNLVNVKQILEISSFLVNLLTDTKHRGAFEQAFVAFNNLCAFLWSSSHPQLHSHPQKMLEEILAAVTDTKNSAKPQLCATRRSAGVPFIVQAVVTTDPDPAAALLRATMERLLAAAADTEAADTESRVHCLNILRALFRDAKLGELVAGWAEAGVRLAVTSYSAADWAERNAATLLFSALVTRIFGVKREKDSLSAKNCLTGKIFFQRYPSLHQFFLGQLSKPELELGSRRAGVLVLDCALYPVLLVLSRIYPSPTETLSNPFPLAAFLPLVYSCSASAILQTRQLAAAALVPLVSPDTAEEYVSKLLAKLQGSEVLAQNNLHGDLLIVKEFVLKYPSLKDIIRENLQSDDVVNKYLVNNPCCLTSQCLLSIVNIIGQPTQAILTHLRDTVLKSEENTSWRPLLQKEAATIVIQDDILHDRESQILCLLRHAEYEVRKAALAVLADTLPIAPVSVSELPRLEAELHPEVQAALLQYQARLGPPSLDSHLLAPLLELADTADSDAIRAGVIAVCSNMDKESWDAGALITFAQLLKDSLDPHHPDTVREAAAAGLVRNHSLLGTAIRATREASCVLWSACLRVFSDDEPRVREAAVQLHEAVTGARTSPSLARAGLLSSMVRQLGGAWPAGCLVTCLGSVLAATWDGEAAEMALDTDRAYDKNEMNCHQEAVGHALLVVPAVRSLVSKLSPRMQEVVMTAEMSPQLMRNIMPDLPGTDMVTTLEQLVKYLADRVTGSADETERLVLALVLKSLKCKWIDNQFPKLYSSMKSDLPSEKTFFSTFIEQLCDFDVKRG